MDTETCLELKAAYKSLLIYSYYNTENGCCRLVLYLTFGYRKKN